MLACSMAHRHAEGEEGGLAEGDADDVCCFDCASAVAVLATYRTRVVAESLVVRTTADGAAYGTGGVAELDERTQLLALNNGSAVNLTIPRAENEGRLIQHLGTSVCWTLEEPVALPVLGVDQHLELCTFKAAEKDEVKVGFSFSELSVAFEHLVVRRGGAAGHRARSATDSGF